MSKAADIKPSSPQQGGYPPPRGVSDLPVPYCEYFLAKGESTAL
uniref:Malignant T-cell-amplified sequence 1, Density-regulated initiation, Ribosome, TRANSLATION n=1 Tax=Siphoviridae sp. ctL5G6 TaxID=2826247 RepID=A0A8S5N9E9_9CAUD|nr:MAG TPA: Malignant T-cell-amplified sequence 1, Density-regulated initiation, Ribosome, TRANSLATION [Siphoviridae sp. ctL5G6]DAM20155.1 MAG TPA: Malignant T-cell-amplified sequence 1, Density-regulated initiation, Ribosome, TRANSLATION [Caudoviricetes sp.]